uniref:SKICH domain-containing protein n=1 Tax=Timema bartmani TaxID=61472 RepID=A0A7R9I2T9_9NEOP|nr:unnamed protein product [Timema bartmani]
MASGSSSNGDPSKVSFVDLSSVLTEYSIPHICEISPQSLLEKSQYGKVIFHEIADSYPTDADICCRYSMTNGVTYCHGDRVSLYKVGWRYAEEFLHFEWAPGPPESTQTEFQILFKANNLPKDVHEIYQFCYMTANNEMCGASGPFQFHRSDDNELCIVEEQDGMVVVRSRSAVAQEKLREAERTSESLKQEKTELENKLQKLQDNHDKMKRELEETLSQLGILHTEKQSLEKKFADMAHMERHMSRLQQNLLSIDTDKNDAEMKLRKAESHIQVLTATVDTLASDKEHMSELLRTEAKQSSEMGQYKNQVESLQHMLDVLTQSKEMVAQELRVELATNAQSKEDLLRLENAVKELKGKLTVLESEKLLLLKQLDELQKKDAEKSRELKELHTEKAVLQKALDTAMEDSAKVDLVKQVEELKRNKDLMLSQLIQAAGVDKSNKELIAELTSRLPITVQESVKLKKQLAQTQEELVDHRRCLADALLVKTSLTKKLEKIDIAGKTNCRELEERNELLEKNIVLLRNELEIAKAKVAQSAPDSFSRIFSQMEDNKQELEAKLKEAREGEKEQTNRLETIQQRLQEIHPEMLKTSEETSAMQMTYLTQNEELKKLRENLISLQGQASWNFRNIHQEVITLEDEVQSTECFVESSHMRVIQLEQRGLELRQEMQVLTQQLETAEDRLRGFVSQRKTLQKKIVDSEELERQLLREHLEVAPPFQDGSNSTNDQAKEQFLNKLENSATFSQKSGSQLEEELKLRLKLAAAEYRKLYLEKQKVERRLLKLCQKLSDRSRVTLTSTGNEPEEAPIAELVNVSSTEPALASSSQVKGGPDFCFICPICSVSFPPGAYDIFTEHFDNHLS